MLSGAEIMYLLLYFHETDFCTKYAKFAQAVWISML